MGFSEKMRESLGAEGVRLTLRGLDDPLVAGTTTRAIVELEGGTKAAHVFALVVRIVEADRHWLDPQGRRVGEDEAQQLDDRTHLKAGWDRLPVLETRIKLGRDIEPGTSEQVALDLEVPEHCRESSPTRSHTLNVQADIRGQIDPTANARMIVRTA